MRYNRNLTTRTGALLLAATVLVSGAWALLPSGAQADTPSPVRQAESPLATPALEEEGASGSASEAASQSSAAPAVAPLTAMGRSSVRSYAMQSTTPMSVTITGEPDAEALRTFLGYLLSGYGAMDSAITVTVGMEPTGWPLELALPEGTEIAGGFIRRGEYEENVLFVQGDALIEEAIDAAATADEDVDEDVDENIDDGAAGETLNEVATATLLLDAIRQSLLEADFTVPPDDIYGSAPVFLPTVPYRSDVLCDAAGEYVVSLGPVAISGESPAVRMNLSSSRLNDVCRDSDRPSSSPMFEMLPQLAPPQGAEVLPRGSGVGGDNVEVEAQINTELSAEELAEHYEAQLDDAGWESLERATADPVAWSIWRFEDDEGNPWTATFTIIQQGNDATHFVASLNAQRQR